MSNDAIAAAVRAAAGANAAEEAKPFELNAATLKAHVPALAAELAAEGAAAERSRIEGIRAAAFPGQEALSAEMIADGKTTAGEAALRFNAAQKGKLAATAQAIKDNDKLVEGAKPAPVVTDASAKPGAAKTPDGWKQDYAASDELQAEFGSEAAYVAFKSAEKTGRVRTAPKRAA